MLTVEVHHEDDGSYWATIKELPGCFATGYTPAELLDALCEAVALIDLGLAERFFLNRNVAS